MRIQPFDLAPQWMPQAWDVSVTVGAKTLKLESAQPNYASAPTPAGGLDLEVVCVGLGSDVDYVGKNVRGKAVFVFTQVWLHLGQNWTALAKRADAKGAAAYLEVDMLPGNMRCQGYPVNAKTPTFTIGSDDGFASRDLVATSPDQTARVKMALDVSMIPNLKTSPVWGALPGASDETIYVMAHRDGWFDGA
ncbi:MAG: hypothetical protein IT181_25875, partial [Acidobacteria bacterium]|nr:hypothetical protein [Acidobacteriota bacterium]